MLLSPNFEKKLKHSNSASFCPVLRGQLKSLITHTRLLLLVGIVLAIPLAPSVGAQAISVTGVVRTSAGAPVAGATVTITAAGAQQERHAAITGADGNFTTCFSSAGTVYDHGAIAGATADCAVGMECRRSLHGARGL